MAEEKKVLFKIEIDTKQSEAAINQLTDATEKNTNAINKTKEAIKAEEGSIAALREQNKKLTAERNATSTATEEGRKKIQQLNDEIDKNNKTIKENVDSLTKQKINIGNYQSALDGLVPGLGGVINGIRGMTTASLTFIATPIGAVVAALGLALGALVAYFKGSEEGQDRWNKITQIGSAILGKITDVVMAFGKAIFEAFENPKQAMNDFWKFLKENIQNRIEGLMELFPKLGEAISLVFEGKFAKAGQVANDAILKVTLGVEDATRKMAGLVNNIIDTVNTAVQEGSKVADLQKEIRALERQYELDSARTSLEVSKIRNEAIKLEGDARRAKIEEAIKLEQRLADNAVRIADKKFELAKLEDKISENDIEANNALIKAEVELIRAQEQRYTATLRFEKELEKLNDEKRAKEEEERKRREKQEEEEKKRKRDEEIEQARIEAEQAENNRKFLEEKKKEDAKKEIELEQRKTVVMGGLISRLTKNRIDGQKAYNTFFKQGALKETFVNTKAAAVAAYKALAGIPLVGPTLGTIAAAAAIAYGLREYASILAIPFAKGGLSGTRVKNSHGIPIYRSNGDNILATLRVGEVVLNERQQAKLGGPKTFAAIGVPGFASGGAVQSVASNAGIDLKIVKEMLEKSQRVLVLEDFQAKQKEVETIKVAAQL